METKKRGRGNPGRSGTLDGLFSRAFSDISEEAQEDLLKSIEENIFSGINSADVYRNYKAADVRIVEAIYGFLKGETEDTDPPQKDIPKDPPPDKPVVATVDSIQAGPSSFADSLKDAAFPPPPPSR